MKINALFPSLAAGLVLLQPAAPRPEKLLPVERVPWMEETHCLEMFSAMTQGPDGRIYAGTCNGVKMGACLIAFDPKTGSQEKLRRLCRI